MSNIVSATLIRDARKSLQSAMTERITLMRTGVTVPGLVAVDRRRAPLRGMPESLAVRRWRFLMPSGDQAIWGGADVLPGDRLSRPGNGVYMVMEITDPNTYNVSTSVYAVQCNAQVTFKRPSVAGVTTGVIDVYISRVSDEMKSWGVLYDWEVWWDTSVQFSGSPLGGVLISSGDEIAWTRAPNPLPGGGQASLDKPRYAYVFGGAIATAYFKEKGH